MLKQPEDISECVYHTRRSINNGKIRAWVFKELCPKCGKALMGKPKDPKTGKPKIRAKEYTCPECNYTIGKTEYEDTLTVNIEYTCPFCSFKGETQIPFKRKKVKILNEEQKKKTINTLRFQCEKCKKDIDITQKMK